MRPSEDIAALRCIYLDDHWAGSAAGSALAARLARGAKSSPWAAELERVAEEIREDRQVLAKVRSHLGCDGGNLKTAVALLAERVGRLKPNGRVIRSSPLSRLVELEALVSGVAAKQRLWAALRHADEGTGSLAGFDVARLEERAQAQMSTLQAIQEAVAGEVLDLGASG